MSRALEILVVEDEVDVQRLVDVVFRVAAPGGFLVQRAGTLEEAVKSVMAMTPDLILLDLHLPDAQGLEALKALRDLSPHAAIVVLTSNTDEQLAFEGIQLGAQDWLQKGGDLHRVLPRASIFAVERQRQRRLLEDAIARLSEGVEG
jgi:DNA-binding response OmpR family regulator